MPATYTNRYTHDKLEPAIFPEDVRSIVVNLAVSTTFVKGQVLGRVTASGLYDDYNDAAVDGLEVARAIMPYACSTDASGNVSFGDIGSGEKTVDVYVAGCFKESDLTGWNAAAAVDMKASTVIAGAAAANPIVRIP